MRKKVVSGRQSGIHKGQISKAAITVLETLNRAGFDAYLVGGCVRDLLLGHRPKDFDIVTNALPDEIKASFRRCIIIGRRFRLAHVYIGRQMIEVATFRGAHEEEHVNEESGFIFRDNIYGTIEEDAVRRDFTINALYYNLKDDTIIDYCGGLKDLKKRKLRMIGDAAIRYREDPVRMVRAVRIASKLEFQIESKTAKPIGKLKHLLPNISASRLYDEVVKLFHCGHAVSAYSFFKKYQLLEELFGLTFQFLDAEYDAFLTELLANTDRRIKNHDPVTPAFLYAGFLWSPCKGRQQELVGEGIPKAVALDQATRDVLQEQTQFTHIPRRHKLFIREVWRLQHRLLERKPRFIRRILKHPQFRAAYDFFLLRAQSENRLNEIAGWWGEIQLCGFSKQNTMISRLRKSR